jgi:phage baseplate assembly protein W
MTGIAYSDDFFKIVKDIDVVADNLRRYILTSPSERVQNYPYGSKFMEYLFQYDPVIRQDIIAELEKIAAKVVPAEYEISNYIIESIPDEYKMKLTFDLKDRRTNEVVVVKQDFTEGNA